MATPSMLRVILNDLKERDWYQDKYGRIFEWGFDIDANIHRWFEIDVNIVGSPPSVREKMLPFADLHLWGLGGRIVYKRKSPLGPYRIQG